MFWVYEKGDNAMTENNNQEVEVTREEVDAVLTRLGEFAQGLSERDRGLLTGIMVGGTEQQTAEDVGGHALPLWILRGIWKCAPYASCFWACWAAWNFAGTRATYCGDYCYRRYPSCR